MAPQIKNLIGRVRENNHAARAERTGGQSRSVLCKTTTEVKLPHFDADLLLMWAYSQL